jgi:hypothetical protein
LNTVVPTVGGYIGPNNPQISNIINMNSIMMPSTSIIGNSIGASNHNFQGAPSNGSQHQHNQQQQNAGEISMNLINPINNHFFQEILVKEKD